ncbi:MAG: tRNA threonylcarbamoyladenosine dehydratase, partial [Oscillospiraceae bacterium]|nr:tRNA threonylcarbamoyladenosine dehydratase [Oscillospiraceae bacterium]
CTSCKKGCVCPPGTTLKCTDRRQIPGSVAFVPPVAGLILAAEVVKDLTSPEPGEQKTTTER